MPVVDGTVSIESTRQAASLPPLLQPGICRRPGMLVASPENPLTISSLPSLSRSASSMEKALQLYCGLLIEFSASWNVPFPVLRRVTILLAAVPATMSRLPSPSRSPTSMSETRSLDGHSARVCAFHSPSARPPSRA